MPSAANKLRGFALYFKGYFVGIWNHIESAEFMKARYKPSDAAQMTLHDMAELPIAMILHCPKCHRQHVDEAEPEHLGPGRWLNPPHKTHLCRLPEGCGHLWRPADVPTTGVESL
jgi:hypothetical protein